MVGCGVFRADTKNQFPFPLGVGFGMESIGIWAISPSVNRRHSAEPEPIFVVSAAIAASIDYRGRCDLLKRLLEWHRRLRHVHEWHDWYVFDSSANVSLSDPRRYRVVGQALMKVCRCGRVEREPLATWEEARALRRRLPYVHWGVMVHRAPLPAALCDSQPAVAQ